MNCNATDEAYLTYKTALSISLQLQMKIRIYMSAYPEPGLGSAAIRKQLQLPALDDIRPSSHVECAHLAEKAARASNKDPRALTGVSIAT